MIFSEPGVPVIYDPASTGTRQPFPGNIDSASTLSAGIRANVIALIPDPTVGRLAGNYNFVNTTRFRSLHLEPEVRSRADLHQPILILLQQRSAGAGRHCPIFRAARQWPAELSEAVTTIGSTTTGTCSRTLLMHTQWSRTRRRGRRGTTRTRRARAASWDSISRVIRMRHRASSSAGPAGLSPYGHPDGKVANGAQYNKQCWVSQGYTWLRGKHEFKFGGAWRRFETLGDRSGQHQRPLHLQSRPDRVARPDQYRPRVCELPAWCSRSLHATSFLRCSSIRRSTTTTPATSRTTGRSLPG